MTEKHHNSRNPDDLAEERTEEAEERSEMAEKRTSFAEDRTLLANERTFAGWARTSFTSIGLGLGFQALFGKAEPVWVPKCIATLFILLGIFVIWLGEMKANRVLEKHSGNHVKLTKRRTYRILAVSVSLGGIALIASLWFLV